MTSTEPSAAKLLEAARRLMSRPDARTAGVWPRAAAHLARQALEGILDEIWRGKAPGVERASTRAQLLCLPAYLGNRELCRSITYTWNALSRACHHHPYELAPTEEELKRWLEVIEQMTTNGEKSRENRRGPM